MSALDRAAGALLGLACGDAVGTTVEFSVPGSFTPLTDMTGGGPFHLPKGAWTDDTSMAMCLAESILDCNGLDAADQLRRYVMWWRDGYWSSTGTCFDIGGATSKALSRFEHTGEIEDAHPDEEAAANGSLMRLAPVAIRWHSNPETASERAGESSRTTHPARRPVDACRALGAMVAALIGGADFESVVAPTFWQWGELHPEIAAVVAGRWRTRQPPEIRGTGYCVDALEAAIWAVAGASDFRQAILRAANLGDDADTTAAIAGQLAGARWGRSGIPSKWLRALHSADRIEEIAVNLYLAGARHEPPPAWGHDEMLHAWWAVPGVVLAGEYPGHTNSAQATAKLNLLADAGVRTFVDLTTADDHLEPYEDLLAAIADVRGIDLRRLSRPIPDVGVVDGPGYDEISESIRSVSERGAVYVHCWGGVGRTGTVIGRYLVYEGVVSAAGATEALRELRRGTRKAHHGSPETHEQIARVREGLPRPG